MVKEVRQERRGRVSTTFNYWYNCRIILITAPHPYTTGVSMRAMRHEDTRRENPSPDGAGVSMRAMRHEDRLEGVESEINRQARGG